MPMFDVVVMSEVRLHGQEADPVQSFQVPLVLTVEAELPADAAKAVRWALQRAVDEMRPYYDPGSGT